MSLVRVNALTISLDGFVAGPDQSEEQPLGAGAEHLHDWAFATKAFREAHDMEGGSTGTVQAMMDAGHPFVPVAGESENGFRKLIAEHSDEGLKGISIGQSPGLVAISIKAAISALEGNPMPQLISVPLPVADHTTLRDGETFWSDLPDNFFTVNEFPPCGVNISGPAIMAQSEADM